MLSRKGLILTLAALFFATILITGTAVQGTAGGGPQPPPYTWKAVGPELIGELTLVPSPDNRSLLATLKGACGKEKVTITGTMDTPGPADEVTAAQITSGATNKYLGKGTYTLKDPKNIYKPASGKGDLIILEALCIRVTGTGETMQATGCAKITYIDKKLREFPKTPRETEIK